MKKKYKKSNVRYLLLFFLCIVVTMTSLAQDSITIIRLGVKSEVPNSQVEEKIETYEYNFIDAFEYELIKLLKTYIETREDYELKIIPIEQNKKSDAIKNGDGINSLLFTFSETSKRAKAGVLFSRPYFQNKAIGIITNNQKVDIRSLSSQVVRIGSVTSTTSEEQLKILEKRYPDNIVISGFKNHAELIEALNNKIIDAAAGDVSRLVHDVNEGNFYFGGNLPTRRSKIADNYVIGISPSSPHLKPLFDDFINENNDQINLLRDKWLSTTLEDAYQAFYNRKESELKKYIIIISIVASSVIAMLLLGFSRIVKRKNRLISESEAGNIDVKFGEIVQNYEAKGRQAIKAKDIANIGIKYFETAKHITYVGSGGFLSDKELGPAWSRALHNFLSNDNTVFERIIDLPATSINEQYGTRFDSTYNFRPEKLPDNYQSSYIRWLFELYAHLKKYDNLKVVNSRGAALWGYGIVIMIKDNDEALIFSTYEDQKIGTTIQVSELVENIAKIIGGIREIGKILSENDLSKEFFTQDKRLEHIKQMIDKEGIDSINVKKSIKELCKSL